MAVKTLKLNELVEPEILQQIQDNFAKAIDMPTIIVDKDGIPVVKTTGLNNFCQLIRCTPQGALMCQEFDAKIEKETFTRDNGSKIYLCDAGLCHFVAPIILKDVYIGSIGIEGTRILAPVDSLKIKRLAEKLNLNPKELLTAFKNIKEFPQEKIYMASDLISSIANTISHLCLQKHDLKHKIAELATLSHIGKAIASTLDLEKLSHLIINTAASMLEADTAIIYLIDEEKDELVGEAIHNAGHKHFEQSRIKIGVGLAGWVAKHKKPLLVYLGMNKPKFEKYLQSEEITSCIAVPLKIREMLIGVFMLKRKSGENFTDDDVIVLDGLANQATIAIKDVKLYKAMEQKIAQLSVLSDITKAVVSTLNINEVLKLIVEATSRTMHTRMCSIKLLAKQKLILSASIGLSNSYLKKGEIEVDASIENAVIKDKKPISVSNIKTDARIKNPEYALKEGIAAFLSAPLMVKDKILGVITIYSQKPYHYTEEEKEILITLASQSAIAIENASLFKTVKEGLLNTTKSLAEAIDAKDAYTRGHCDRVAQFAVSVAQKLGVSESKLENIYIAALLHDVGKIGVSENILHKPGGLTRDEFETIKNHPLLSVKILSPISFPWDILPAVRQHHERIDGAGYPDGLAGDEISLEARIIEVTDAYEAMISDRPYRKALSEEDAIVELKRCSGRQFDPKIVNVFLKVLAEEKARNKK
ncbi:MAG: HD domain-containing phosphohydrolase [bacterium]